jgi:hypothetical protein
VSWLLRLKWNKEAAFSSLDKQNDHVVFPNFARRITEVGYVRNGDLCSGKSNLLNNVSWSYALAVSRRVWSYSLDQYT